MTKPQYQWPAGLRQAILDRDGQHCQIRLPDCTGKATAIDHIIPVSEGGAWFDPTNLRAACRYCNTALANPRARHHRQPDPQPSRHW